MPADAAACTYLHLSSCYLLPTGIPHLTIRWPAQRLAPPVGDDSSSALQCLCKWRE